MSSVPNPFSLVVHVPPSQSLPKALGQHQHETKVNRNGREMGKKIDSETRYTQPTHFIVRLKCTQSYLRYHIKQELFQFLHFISIFSPSSRPFPLIRVRGRIWPETAKVLRGKEMGTNARKRERDIVQLRENEGIEEL